MRQTPFGGLTDNEVVREGLNEAMEPALWRTEEKCHRLSRWDCLGLAGAVRWWQMEGVDARGLAGEAQ